MPAKFQVRRDRQSGPLLASTVVMFLGAIAAAVVTTASGQNPYVGLLIFVALASFIPVLLLFSRVTPRQAVLSIVRWVRNRRAKPKVNYEPRAVRATRTYGTNRPPSATELKELKGGTNNWVPSNVAPSKRPGRPSASGDVPPSY